MRALSRFALASVALAFIGSPAFAGTAEPQAEPKLAVAQQSCQGWGVRCEPEALPQYCISADKCATALPASALVRYDALMDAAAAR